jgi:hypothetical protein
VLLGGLSLWDVFLGGKFFGTLLLLTDSMLKPWRLKKAKSSLKTAFRSCCWNRSVGANQPSKSISNQPMMQNKFGVPKMIFRARKGKNSAPTVPLSLYGDAFFFGQPKILSPVDEGMPFRYPRISIPGPVH